MIQFSWPGGISKSLLPTPSHLATRSIFASLGWNLKAIWERSQTPVPSPGSLL